MANNNDNCGPICGGCSGRGEVGNIIDTQQCPYCKGAGIDPEVIAEIEAAAVEEFAAEQFNDDAGLFQNYVHKDAASDWAANRRKAESDE